MLNQHQIEEIYQSIIYNENNQLPCEILNHSSQLIPKLIIGLNTHLEHQHDDIHKYIIILNKLVEVKSKGLDELKHLNFQLFIKHMNQTQYEQIGHQFTLLNNISKITNEWELEIYQILLNSFEKIRQPNVLYETIHLIVKISKKIPQQFTNILNNNNNKRYFGECLLQLLNRLTDQSEIIEFFAFIDRVYGKVDQFFYLNDMKVAIDIIIRFLEDPISNQLTQKCMQTFLFFTCSEFYQQIKHYRMKEIKSLIENIVTQSQAGSQMKQQLLSLYLQ